MYWSWSFLDAEYRGLLSMFVLHRGEIMVLLESAEEGDENCVVLSQNFRYWCWLQGVSMLKTVIEPAHIQHRLDDVFVRQEVLKRV